MGPRIRDHQTSEMFEALLEGIHESGLTLAEIARQVGISQAHLHRLRNGEIQSPSYELGCRIIELHKKRVTA